MILREFDHAIHMSQGAPWATSWSVVSFSSFKKFRMGWHKMVPLYCLYLRGGSHFNLSNKNLIQKGLHRLIFRIKGTGYMKRSQDKICNNRKKWRLKVGESRIFGTLERHTSHGGGWRGNMTYSTSAHKSQPMIGIKKEKLHPS